MQLRKPPAALVPLLLLALCACGPEDDVPLIPMDATLEARMASEGLRYGEYAQWPEDIPPDIPPLQGEIRVVKVIPGQQYRIDYSAVTKEAIAQYLAQLEALGFQLDYFVYTAPSIPDDQTAARIARGEWDTVEITKGPYHMRLEAGDLGANLDIDNADFMTPGPPPRITPTPLVWPSDIPARVPQPATCQMTYLTELGGEYAGGYQIEFDCTDPLVQERFVEALLAAGLTETDRLVSDTGQNVYITLADSDVAVKAGGVVGSFFMITVWPAGGLKGTPSVWPTATRGSLPRATPNVGPTATPIGRLAATPTTRPMATTGVGMTQTASSLPKATPTVRATATAAALPTATRVTWPSDIPARIPEPPSCRVFYVGALETGGYLIGLDCPEHGLHERFVEALLAAGLTETHRAVSTAGDVVELTLQDDEIAVDVFPNPGAGYTIQVRPLTQ